MQQPQPQQDDMAANLNPSTAAIPISAPVPSASAAVPPGSLLTDARFPPTRGAAPPPAYYPRFYSGPPGVPGVPGVPPAGNNNVPGTMTIAGSQPLANMNANVAPAVPQLTYMEGQLTTQAMLVEQQRRIKQLEAELYATRAEVQRLTQIANEARGNSNSNGGGNINAAMGSNSLEKKPSSRYWTPDEHKRFLEGLELFGPRDIKAISRHVGTRSATQVRTHAQKYYLRIERERERAKASGTDPPPNSNNNPHQHHYVQAKSPNINTPTATKPKKSNKLASPRKRTGRHRTRNATNANKPPPQPDEGKTHLNANANSYVPKKAPNININSTTSGKKLPFERKRTHSASNLIPESNDDMTILMGVPDAADEPGTSPTGRRVKPKPDPAIASHSDNNDDNDNASLHVPIPKIEAAEPTSGTGAGGLLSNGTSAAADTVPADPSSALPPAPPSLVVGSIPFVPSSGALMPPFATSSSSLTLHQVPSSNTLDRALASYVGVPASLPQVPSVGALGTLMSSSGLNTLNTLPRVSSTTGLPHVASSGALQLPRVASSLTAAWNGQLAADKAALAAEKPATGHLPTSTAAQGTGTATGTGLRRVDSGTALRRVDSTASIGLGRGLARTNSILSLLSGLPTAGASDAATGTTPGSNVPGSTNGNANAGNGNGSGGRAPFEHMELEEDPSKWTSDS